MVKQHFENTVRQLEAEKERQLAVVRDKAMREIVAPHNAEVDQSRAKAIQELSAQLNAEITSLQERFAIEKQALIDVGEKNKVEFAEATIANETAAICREYDTAIANMQALIAKCHE